MARMMNYSITTSVMPRVPRRGHNGRCCTKSQSSRKRADQSATPSVVDFLTSAVYSKCPIPALEDGWVASTVEIRTAQVGAPEGRRLLEHTPPDARNRRLLALAQWRLQALEQQATANASHYWIEHPNDDSLFTTTSVGCQSRPGLRRLTKEECEGLRDSGELDAISGLWVTDVTNTGWRGGKEVWNTGSETLGLDTATNQKTHSITSLPSIIMYWTAVQWPLLLQG